MEASNEDNIGKSLYQILGDSGPPWGVGTTSIIAGLGVRLLHLSITKSGGKGFSSEMKTFFKLCDKDDQIFEDYLDHKSVNLNSIPNKMIIMIFSLLEEVMNKDHKIKAELIIDFNMGIDYLYVVATQTLNIIKNNQSVGGNLDQFENWKKRLTLIEDKLKSRERTYGTYKEV